MYFMKVNSNYLITVELSHISYVWDKTAFLAVLFYDQISYRSVAFGMLFTEWLLAWSLLGCLTVSVLLGNQSLSSMIFFYYTHDLQLSHVLVTQQCWGSLDDNYHSKCFAIPPFIFFTAHYGTTQIIENKSEYLHGNCQWTMKKQTYKLY